MTDRVYRFAGFELNSAAGELRDGKSTIRLQEKPLLLLTALLDHPQRVVTREQLRQRMWDSRTVVEYEQGINAAIKKVRDALGDSADRPRFVETVAKRGYRLLVPVTIVAGDTATPTAPVTQPALPTATTAEPLTPTVTSAAGAAAPTSSAPGNRFGRRRWLVSIVAAGALSVTALWLYATQIRPIRPTHIQSLAVLPLRDLSPDPGQEYFAEGITEEITTHLAQTLPLRVISRTSAMRYKQTDKPIGQIAKELGVEAIVEGSVARSGNRVSVNVQLIDAIQDRHLWAEKYDRRIEDVIAIEAELSEAIANEVSLSLQRGTPRIVRRVDPQVHELCLLGRYHWNKRTTADLARAEEYFQRAIALDPNYAPAHAGLADVYSLRPHYGATLREDDYPRAVAAARRALALDSSLAEAHATLGFVQVTSRDWIRAGPALRRALELNPSYASARHWYAYYLFFADRLEEANAEIERARQLDPLSATINADQGEFLHTMRRYAEARVRLRRAMELSPDLGQPHATMAVVELETGHVTEALKEARAGIALDPRNRRTIGEAGYVLAATGNTAEATQLLATLKDMASRDTAVSLYAAMIEVGLGRREEALATLENQARSTGIMGLQGLQHWHAFDTLSADPRFQQLLSREAR